MSDNNKNLEALIREGLVVTSVGGEDYVVIKKWLGRNRGTDKRSEEYAIKVSDLLGDVPVPVDTNTWDIASAAFVDPLNGNDATAVVGDGNLPFRSLEVAGTQSNLVIGLPGTYFGNITLSSNTHYHFLGGAVMGSSSRLRDNGSPVNVTITGDLEIGSFSYGFEFSSLGSTADITVSKFNNSRSICFLLNGAHNIIINGNSADVNCNNGAGYANLVSGGSSLTVNIKNFCEVDHWLVAGGTGTGNVFTFNADTLETQPVGAFGNIAKAIINDQGLGSHTYNINVRKYNQLHPIQVSSFGVQDTALMLYVIAGSVNDSSVFNFKGDYDAGVFDGIGSEFVTLLGTVNFEGTLRANQFFLDTWSRSTGAATNMVFNFKNSRLEGGSANGAAKIGAGRNVAFENCSIFAANAAAPQVIQYDANNPSAGVPEVRMYNVAIEHANNGGAILSNDAGGVTQFKAVNTVSSEALGVGVTEVWGGYTQVAGLTVPKIKLS